VLYLVQNKIARIEQGELDWCAETITSLELGGNRIRVSRRGGGDKSNDQMIDCSIDRSDDPSSCQTRRSEIWIDDGQPRLWLRSREAGTPVLGTLR
jgi:hypothetical protein